MTTQESPRLRRLTPASHIQVAVRAMDAIINFNYSKFEAEAGYKAQAPNEEQMEKIVRLKDELTDLRAQFGAVRTMGSGKTIEQRLEAIVKIAKAMFKDLKGKALKDRVLEMYASAYNSSALVGYDDKIDELIAKK